MASFESQRTGTECAKQSRQLAWFQRAFSLRQARLSIVVIPLLLPTAAAGEDEDMDLESYSRKEEVDIPFNPKPTEDYFGVLDGTVLFSVVASDPGFDSHEGRGAVEELEKDDARQASPKYHEFLREQLDGTTLETGTKELFRRQSVRRAPPAEHGVRKAPTRAKELYEENSPEGRLAR